MAPMAEALRAFVEVALGGGAAGWVLDLPGCYCWAPDHDGVLSMLPRAARRASAWLSGHGESVELPSPLSLEVVELLVRDGSMGRGGSWALFLPDLAPLSDDDLRRGLTYLEWSRHDLLETLAGLPEDAMEWRLPGSRSVREILMHLAETDWWYVSRLVAWPRPHDPPTHPVEALRWSRERCAYRLRSLTPAERAAVTHPDDATATRIWGIPEPWTARKVLRRMLYHELYHTESLRRIAASHGTAPGRRRPAGSGSPSAG